MKEIEDEDEFEEKIIYVPGDDSCSDDDTFPDDDVTNTNKGSEEVEEGNGGDWESDDDSGSERGRGVRLAVDVLTSHKTESKSNLEKLLTAMHDNDVKRAIYLVNIC